MGGLEARTPDPFKPDPGNEQARFENELRKKGKFHDVEGLHDQEGSRGIDPATGTIGKTEAVDGADESKQEKKIRKGKSSDLMGKTQSGPMGEIPDDPAKIAEYFAREEARLEKQNRKKAA